MPVSSPARTAAYHGSDAFSPDYFRARQRFMESARAVGAGLESHSISAAGPRGEELSIDVARIGDERATSVLVVTSGLHGVEGFLGSAVQFDLLRRWMLNSFPGDKVRLVMIHALNPWGFAHLRRVNEDNVDPNRNLITANDSYARAPEGYAHVDPFLNPRRPPTPFADLLFMLLGAGQICRLGMRQCKQIVATGQYEYPYGLFYGGQHPIQSHCVMKQNLDRWLEKAERVLHLDFHSGLGRWGTHCLLLDMPIEAGRMRWLNRVFPDTSIEPFAGPLAGYGVRGSLGQWSQGMLPNCEYTYLCAEFGTYSPLRVLQGPVRQRAKQRLAELFCPASTSWRRQALHGALHLVQQAARALEP
jgi:hypothetical protein